MNYLALKEELSLPEYDGMTNAQKMAHYNAKTVEILQRASLEDVNIILFESGKHANLKRRLEGGVGPLKDLAESILDLFKPDSHMTTVDVNKAPFKAGINAFRQVSDLEQAQVDAIMALGKRMVHVSEIKPGLPKTISEQMADDALNGGY